MPVSLLFRLIFLVNCPACWPQDSSDQAGPLPSVLKAETARFAAMVSTDTTTLRDMLDPDLIYIHSNGLEESADDLVASVAAGGIVYQSFEPQQPPRVRTFGETALVDGLVQVSGRYRGNAFLVNLRYTSVYRKVDGRWRLIRWQSLKV